MMICNRRILSDVFQTGREMMRLTLEYWPDLGRWLDEPFLHFYHFVCLLPYREDPKSIETISRPLYTLKEDYEPRDCDDKSVLCASWLHAHGIPVRFVAVSTNREKVLNHVFCQTLDGLDIDATYADYAKMLGKYPYSCQVTKRTPLTNYF